MQGDAQLVVAFRVGRRFVCISNCQNVDRFQMGREIKFTAQDIRLEVTHPNSPQSQLLQYRSGY